MASKYEDELADQLDEEGIAYEREFRFHPKRMWRADFFIPDYKLLVEVDGVSYRGQVSRHQTGVGFQRDAVKYNEAVVLGYKVLRFTPAMVSGNAKNSLKGVKYEEKAIDTIKRWISEQGTGKGNQ